MSIDWDALPPRPWTTEYDGPTGDWPIFIDGKGRNFNVDVALDGPIKLSVAMANLWAATPDMYEALAALIEAQTVERLDCRCTVPCDVSECQCRDCLADFERFDAGCAALRKAEGVGR